ncbi:MAG TPA: DUF6325 family protein [Candidatus Limnocylindrales bacterium]|nr:DUF6325 family protein [Candidatus Limnocylindrales bacterium]
MATETQADIELGPIDYIVVEWPASNQPNGEALPLLVDLVDRGLIRILDLAFIHVEDDGTVTGIDINAVGGELSVFEGASTGLIDQDDIDQAGGVLERGSSAALLVYENTWAAPFATSLRKAGAQLVSSGRIPVNAILARLDQLEAGQA